MAFVLNSSIQQNEERREKKTRKSTNTQINMMACTRNPIKTTRKSLNVKKEEN
jgi:hypothetical protein